MRENMLVLLNHILGQLLPVVIAGIIYVLVLEYKTVFEYVKAFGKKKSEFKMIKPVVKKFGYILCGVLLVLFSFSITNTILGIFLSPPDLGANFTGDPDVLEFSLKGMAPFSGLFTVIGFIASGYVLILSGGGRWMLNLAKLLVTLSVFWLFLMSFAAFA